MTLTHIITDIYGVLLLDEEENKPLLGWYQQQQAEVYLASNISRATGENLFCQPHWQKVFSGVFTSDAIGYAKPTEAFFLHIEKELGLTDPEKVLFIDDTLDNVTTARHLGWQGYHYKGWSQMKKDFDID